MENAHGAGARAAVVKEKPTHGDPLESQVGDARAASTASSSADSMAKSRAESIADEPAAQPIVPDRPGVNDASAPTDEAIARRAYELYCARGCVDGFDQDDWLQAEREIRATIVYPEHIVTPDSPID
jgi:Protein of unknown function (DUF2934)